MTIQIVYRSSEVKLMEALNDIGDPVGWRAVHFHLGDLLEQYQSDYQVKIAVNLVHDLLKSYMGGIFLMGDHSLVVLCYRMEKTLLGKLIFQLRYLYMDDPLAYTEDGQDNPAFCTAYDLSRDWQAFHELATRRMAIAGRRAAKPEERPEGAPEEKREHGDFSASKLAGIERDLRHADISRAIRRQSVCAVLPGVPVRRVFDELYIHIAHLRQMLKSEEDFLSNRWLFKYLTHILDERVIEMIRISPASYLERPISLNLNVETLLSTWFAEFDAAMKPAAKSSIILEIPVVDVFADMAAFLYARQEAQKLGYRVCLDGLTTRSFVNINREKLGFDLIKVQWNADVESDLMTKENRELAEAVKTTGANRIILCRCDNQQAVQYGQGMGISLFQGRHLDALLDPSSKVEN